MKIKIELNPPRMPNFLSVKQDFNLRECNQTTLLSIPVDKLTEDEAMEYADWMKARFLDHWQRKRSEK